MSGQRRCVRGLAALVVMAALSTGCSADEAAQPAAAPSGSVSAPRTESPTQAVSPTSPPTPKPPRTFTVAMSGDVLLHSGLWYTAQNDAERTGRGAMDFRPLLSGMRSVISGADLAICHLETPLAPRGGPYASYPVFAAPQQIVPALHWVGYDACTTASNHSLDQGYEGIVRTLRVLTATGVQHTGNATSRRESRRPLLLDVNGVRVGLVSATYGTNGIPIPEEQPWSVPLIRAADILREAKLARRLGAEVVLVALHWGLEYQNEPSEDQVSLARRLLATPAIDLVYGHHAHVVQPFDRVHDKWIAYGLGNAIAQQDTAVAGLYDGVTARFTFTEQDNGRFEVKTAEYVPTYTTHFEEANPRMRWLNITAALDAPRTAGVGNPELQAALARIRTEVNLEDALRHGLRQGR